MHHWCLGPLERISMAGVALLAVDQMKTLLVLVLDLVELSSASSSVFLNSKDLMLAGGPCA